MLALSCRLSFLRECYDRPIGSHLCTSLALIRNRLRAFSATERSQYHPSILGRLVSSGPQRGGHNESYFVLVMSKTRVQSFDRSRHVSSSCVSMCTPRIFSGHDLSPIPFRLRTSRISESVRAAETPQSLHSRSTEKR
jgi:hypothetical protein